VIQAAVEGFPKGQTAECRWQRHILQALVKFFPKFQAFKTIWQMDMQALIKFVAESQVLEATWKLHLEHLVKFLSKCQALQGAGESDHLKILATQIAKGSKNQTLQTNWESHLLQSLVAKAV
jgi:hypothetical protein